MRQVFPGGGHVPVAAVRMGIEQVAEWLHHSSSWDETKSQL